MREIRLHDTCSGEVMPLRPREEGRVGIYACGPTVYSRIHIGNARPFVVFSLLSRFLAREGYEVTLVMNVTDVNDKIYDAARARSEGGVSISSVQLAEQMTRHYISDTDALGLGRPRHEPLASQTMGAIVDYIRALVDSDHAYESGGDVFFKVRSDPRYGSLSHRRLDDMDQGEGVEGAERKRDPLDFALWKARKPGEDSWWESPWGNGRPGWHIECSAMAETLLGAGFDIHGGGADLIFPHHENEASQTRCARGEELARIWMHNGMVQITGEKMAKSVGNIAALHEVVEQYGAQTVVMYLISGHYRQPLAFSPDTLEQALANVKRIREIARRLSPDSGPSDASETDSRQADSGQADSCRAEPGRADSVRLHDLREAFFDALANDFNTPLALSHLNEWLRLATHGGEGDPGDDAGIRADLGEMLQVVGLESLLAPDVQAPPGVQDLAEQREQARTRRDFAAADELRERIASLGWEVRDGANGFELLPL